MTRQIITEAEAGQRLDYALAALMPTMGLRGRRRLCEQGLALVNGRPATPARKLKEGDLLECLPLEKPGTTQNPKPAAIPGSLPLAPPETGPDDAYGAYVVQTSPNWAALFKPAGMHSEALAGKADLNLQDLLPLLLPLTPKDNSAQSNLSVAGILKPCLLNRLDYATSGLVLAALNSEGAKLWQRAQDNAQTQKRYLALLEGELTEKRLVRHSLRLKGRERVQVSVEEQPDRQRHTYLEPLAVFSLDQIRACLSSPAYLAHKSHAASYPLASPVSHWPLHSPVPTCVTLAGCTILKGARHQIRAHAADQGFPLLGDWRYGARWTAPEGEHFFLHHARINLPGFSALCLPPWLEYLGAAALPAVTWVHS